MEEMVHHRFYRQTASSVRQSRQSQQPPFVSSGVLTFNLMFLNGIFHILSYAALITGTMTKIMWDPLEGVFEDIPASLEFNLYSNFNNFAVGCIVIGSFSFVISLVGFSGSYFKYRILIAVYGALLIISVSADIVTVGLMAANSKVDHSQDEDAIGEAMNNRLSGHYFENSTGMSRAYSALFQMFECCGIRSSSNTFPSNLNGTRNWGFFADPGRQAAGIKFEVIPIACCKYFDFDIPLTKDIFYDYKKCLNTATPNDEFAWTKGCLGELLRPQTDERMLQIVVLVIVVFLQIIMVALTFALWQRTNKRENRPFP